MKLSVIIPVYNAQQYLVNCLETVAQCPSGEMECILINDGSNDQSLELCKEYIQKDARFQLIDKKNEGVSVARNTGLLRATGEYIFFLDADDYIEPHKWEVILKAMEDAYDFVAFSYYTLYEDGRTENELFDIDGVLTNDISLVRRMLLTTPILNTCWGKLLKREIIRENHIEFKAGVRTGEDALFIMDYIEYTKSCAIYNESIIYYRQHHNSAMRKVNIEEKINDFQAIYDKRNKLLLLWNDIDPDLKKYVYKQFFSVITNLYLDISLKNPIKETFRILINTEKSKMILEIIELAPYDLLSPAYKKLEYQLIKRKAYGALAIYFKIKNLLRR